MKKMKNSEKVAKIISLIDNGGMSVRYGKPLKNGKFEIGLGFVEPLNGKNTKISFAMTKDGEPDAKELANAFVDKILARSVDDVAIRLYMHFKKMKRPVSLSLALKNAKQTHRDFVSLAGKVLKIANAA